MINFTTGKEYQGSNIDELDGLGREFCTFKQAVNYYNLTGKELKGAKSCATLMTVVEKEIINKVTNKKEKNHLIKTMLSNGHAPFEGTDEQEYEADMEAYQIQQQWKERA